MTKPLPIIGRRETQQLEFKSSEALKKPFTISREVVAMLNADGGNIWIGIREQDGVATGIDGVSATEQRRTDLINHLLDVIEPHPNGEEVKLSIVHANSTDDVLVVQVQPQPTRRPYALLKDGGRVFVTRVDHRVRPMTRDEIIHPNPNTTGTPDLARGELVERRNAVLKERRSLFWIGIQPDPMPRLDLQSPELATLLVDPTRSGNRNSGWSFRVPLADPQLKGDRLILGNERTRLVTMHEHGGIDLKQSLEHLEHDHTPKRQIYPLALLEYVVSMTRLASKAYAASNELQLKTVLFDVALTGAEGWTLPAYPPGTSGYIFEHGPPHSLDDGTLALREPLEWTWDRLRDNPDAVGFRIVRAVYQEFGLPDDRIPQAYDRTQQRLLLKD